MYYFNLFLLIWAISFIIYYVLLEKVLIFNNMNKLISINFYVCLKLLHFSIIFHMENSRCLFVLLLFVPYLRKLTLCITLCLKFYAVY